MSLKEVPVHHQMKRLEEEKAEKERRRLEMADILQKNAEVRKPRERSGWLGVGVSVFFLQRDVT